MGGAVTAWSTTTLAATIIGVVPTILESRILYLSINLKFSVGDDNNSKIIISYSYLLYLIGVILTYQKNKNVGKAVDPRTKYRPTKGRSKSCVFSAYSEQKETNHNKNLHLYGISIYMVFNIMNENF